MLAVTEKNAVGKKVSGYWRRGTVNGHLAYCHVEAHARTAKPTPRTKNTTLAVYDPKKHSVVQHCALPKPRDALKIAQSKPRVLTNKPIDVD